MTERKSQRSSPVDGHSAQAAAKEGERIQAAIDKADKTRAKKPKAGPMQAGAREYPDEFPAQHLKKPGREADLQLKPMYEAPGYKGSDKLQAWWP